MSTKPLPVGVSDFRRIIEDNYYYVDKTLFIKEVVDRGDTILLIPRPRRFGKTLNLSMLKYFYDCCPKQGKESPNSHKKLFDSLAISNTGPKYLDKMGKHPVIFLTFKNIKELDWETTYRKITKLIRDEYIKHKYLCNGPVLEPEEQDYFKKILSLEGERDDYDSSLEKLIIFLSRYYGERVVILVDEYDAPIHMGFGHGYYDEIINFMRNFLCGGLKDTDPYLEKCVITGILRVAKESIFSGLNNLGVFTLLEREFGDRFGFTEEEVETLLGDFNLSDRYGEVQTWYNGYRFGSWVIYNPWSIINFLASEDKILKPFWVNTSDNEIVDSLLSNGGKELKEELEQLLRGESIEKAVETNIVLKDLAFDEDALWGFLLMGGYLKQTDRRPDPVAGQTYYTLSIPNQEVKTTYTRIIRRYFSTRIENKKLESMLKALLDGDIDVFEEIFSDYVLNALSFFDTAADPEKVYHAFVMGLLLWLSSDYEIKSNRESGYGRYDIMIIPKDPVKLGFIIEFKKTRKNETLESAIKSALDQIEARKYETGLLERGIRNYKKLAIVFKGKDVVVREG